MSDKLEAIAKRLGVEPSALRGLFEEMVTADTGKTYEDIAALLTTAQEEPVSDVNSEVAQMNAQLAKRWGVTEDVVNQRLGKLNEVYTALPETERGQYESIDGIAALWNVVNVSAPPAPAAPQQQANVPLEGVVSKSEAPLRGISPASLLAGNGRQSSFSFDELVAMPEAEYAKIANDGSLLEAFNAGRVRDTQNAVRPGNEAVSAITGQYSR